MVHFLVSITAPHTGLEDVLQRMHRICVDTHISGDESVWREYVFRTTLVPTPCGPGLSQLTFWFTATLETLLLWWIMLEGHMQGARKHFYTHMHATQTQRNTTWGGGGVHEWEDIKEAQRSVKVKGQTNQGSNTERGTASPHLALVCVCLCV